MFAFNDSGAAAAAAITIGEAEAAADVAAEGAVSNLTRTAQLEDGVQQLLDSWRYQSRIDPPGRYVLILLYAFMIILGSVGNLMVIYVVARNPFMRTARNVFIVNLAISDLMLCLITMPLTLVEILYVTWQFGQFGEFGCRMIGLLQATSIFVSTISIMAIALDRRRLIVGSEQERPEDMGKIVSTIPVIWAAAIAMASPLSIWKTLEPWTEWTHGMFNDNLTCPAMKAFPPENDEGISTDCLLQKIIEIKLPELQTCTEYLPEWGRAGYSIFILNFQFLLPMITLICAYYQICQTLRVRLEQRMRQRNNLPRPSICASTVSATATGDSCGGVGGGNLADRRNSVLRRNDERRERNIMRLKRTIKLLCWIGAIFCICWLPLNILNVLRDFSTVTDSMREEVFCGVYAVCHVLGMSSACANPVIYGFLNENFSREFRAIGSWWVDRCRCARRTPDDASAAATNEVVNNGECNGNKINNGVNSVSANAATAATGNHDIDHGSAANAAERLELLSSSKGHCVEPAGNKNGSMV